MKVLLRLTRMLIKPKFVTLIFIVILSLFISSAPYVFSFLGKWLVDDALQVGGAPRPNAHSEAEKIRLLLIFFIASIGIHIVTTGMGGGAEIIKSKFSHSMIYTLRLRVHEKLEGADLSQFLKEQPGQHMTRLLDDTANIPGNLVNLWVNFVTQIGMLILGAVLLMRLNPKLSLVALAALPFFAVTSIVLLPRIKRTVTDIRVFWSELIGHVVERLSNIETIKNYVQEERETDEFGALVERSLNLARKNHRYNLLLGSVSGIITAFATLAVLIIGIINIRSGAMQLGAALAFYAVTAQLFVPISAIVGMFVVLQTITIYGERVFAVIDAPVLIADAEKPVLLEQFRGEIEFRRVSLRYQEGGPFAVADLSFSIPAGTTVAIVGPTGCGKSTIIALLTRLYDASEGDILIDGTDIKRLPVHQLRRSVGNIFYETPVFSGSIAENISLASSSITDGDIQDAAKRAGLHDFVMEQKSGYNTMLGGGGIQLETIELLKLGIARLLVTDPPIVTVDDTFASVEEHTAEYLQTMLRKAVSGKTLLIATSRLSVAKTCDTIIVLQRGKLIQMGSHQTLIETPGLYRRMHMRQMGLSEP